MDSVIVLPLICINSNRAGEDPTIAGVITEARQVLCSVPLPPGFVTGVRELTQRYGVVMILDEVITRFRWSPGTLVQTS